MKGSSDCGTGVIVARNVGVENSLGQVGAHVEPDERACGFVGFGSRFIPDQCPEGGLSEKRGLSPN